jgi:hypothetical protein
MCEESKIVVSKRRGRKARTILEDNIIYYNIGKNTKQHCGEIQKHRKTHVIIKYIN